MQASDVTPPDPTKEGFFDSKSMILIIIGISAILAISVAAIVAKIIWGVDSFTIVGAAIGGVTAHTTGGVIRNYQVDGTIRQMQAQAAYGFPPPAVQEKQGIAEVTTQQPSPPL